MLAPKTQAVPKILSISTAHVAVDNVIVCNHLSYKADRSSFIYRCAKELNKAMHISHGNTAVKSPTWRQRHRLNKSAQFLFGTHNVGGLQETTKRKRLVDFKADVLGLTETHLQSHLEHSEAMLYPEYHCFWSPNPADRHFRGIGILVRKASFWASSVIKWAPDNSCYKFFADNRLLAVQPWYGTGAMSIC